MNSFSDRPLLAVFAGQAMDMKEPYAEQVCTTTLTTKEPATLDLFDQLHGVHKMKLDINNYNFLVVAK